MTNTKTFIKAMAASCAVSATGYVAMGYGMSKAFQKFAGTNPKARGLQIFEGCDPKKVALCYAIAAPIGCAVAYGTNALARKVGQVIIDRDSTREDPIVSGVELAGNKRQELLDLFLRMVNEMYRMKGIDDHTTMDQVADLIVAFEESIDEIVGTPWMYTMVRYGLDWVDYPTTAGDLDEIHLRLCVIKTMIAERTASETPVVTADFE